MGNTAISMARLLMLLAAGLLSTGVALAEKPEWKGDRKHDKAMRADRKGAPMEARKDGGVELRVHFGDAQRTAVHDYYARQYRSGKCPPGLAKKNNGCLPPGQARKWALGQQLPPDLVYYPLPQAVVVELGIPPAGHRYVRVAADILLIAIGTGIVVDAIKDLGRM